MNRAVDVLRNEDEVDLRDVVFRLWTSRWWIIASVVLFTAAFAAVAFLSTRYYRATVVFVPAGHERSGLAGALGNALGSLGGLASLAGINVSAGGDETQEALAVLRSRQFTEAFVTDKNLMPVLYSRSWDPQAKDWKAGIRPPTLARAYKLFDRSIRSIAEDKKAGLVSLQVEWKDRNQAAEWANELVSRVNDEMRRRAIEKSDASVGYLEKELATTVDLGTREAINRVIEVQIRQRMLANVTQEYAFRVVDRALPADEDDPVRPKKLLLLLAGPLVGFGFGATAVLLLGWLRRAIDAGRPA